MTVVEHPTIAMPRPLPPVPPSKPRRPGGDGRDPRPGVVTTVPPLRLTRRGRIVRDLVAGGLIVGYAINATAIHQALVWLIVAPYPFH